MAENTLALYRKYRPQSFDEVRNQEHIVRVLEGALKKKSIPHALLFTGPRGTGKTTVARIFAHEIGAEDIDIYEIDAASNRGIDDIRTLRDAVHTLPYESPYKVYIIDEVHMLSKDAFNALLKTLEEPPVHVVFILATTEKEKVLDTIISRCQVFEFRAPSRDELRDMILAIGKKEKFKIDAGVADIIALSADGSYRDALGITQKVMLASGDTILSADEVSEIVGAPRSVHLATLLEAFHGKNLEQGLTALHDAHTARVDVKLFYRLLLERIRTVMLLRHNGKQKDVLLAPYSPEEREVLVTMSTDSKSALNSQLLVRLLDVSEYLGKSTIPELPLELCLIEHCA